MYIYTFKVRNISFGIQEVEFRSWKGNVLTTMVMSPDPNDPDAELVIPKLPKGNVAVRVVEDNCGVRITDIISLGSIVLNVGHII